MTKKELVEKRQSLLSEANAIEAKVKEEKRETLTDEERSSFEEKTADIQKIDEQLSKIADDEKRFALLGSLNATAKAPQASRSTNGQINDPPEPEKRSIIPATAIRRRNLKGFSGPDAEERAYRSGQWILARLGGDESREWCQAHGIELRAAHATNNSFLGGYLVPHEFSNAIIDLREQYGVFRSNSKVVPMMSDTMSVPRRDTGLTAYFMAENDSNGITESNKSWSQVQLTARKLAALAKWSSELNADAVISLADDLASEIAYAFAYKEDQCGFLGDGTSAYGGVVGLAGQFATSSYTASTFTAATGNTAFGTLDLDDFEAVVGLLPVYAQAGAKWYISKAGFAASMQRLMYAAGGNTVSNIAGSTGFSFLGYPVVLSQVLNATLTTQTSTILAYFGNLPLASLFGDRQGVRVDLSTERYFETDQIAIRGTERFDINIHSLGSTSVVGPMIAIKTPGS